MRDKGILEILAILFVFVIIGSCTAMTSAGDVSESNGNTTSATMFVSDNYSTIEQSLKVADTESITLISAPTWVPRNMDSSYYSPSLKFAYSGLKSEEKAYQHLCEVMDKYHEFFDLYSDRDAAGNHYIPSGWMGDWDDITFNDSYATDPHSGANCIKINYAVDYYLNNHYIPSGWMGDWKDITFNDSYTTDPHSGANCIKIDYAVDSYQNNHYSPSGWMGDGEYGTTYVKFNNSYVTNPHSGLTCIKITYTIGPEGWTGIYWQDPENNWGDKEGGYDLTGATKLTFWAKGDKGGEKGEFKVGGITGPKGDSIQPAVSSGVITLAKTWQKYTIDLTGKDLSHIIGGFCWVTNDYSNPSGCTFYIDDIKYEYEDRNFNIYTDAQENWAGIYWQDSENNWGDNDGGYNLTGATKLTFWAKGANGSEKGEFKVGGITGPKGDSIQPAVSSGVITLTKTWQKYTIDLTGKDLSSVIGGFCWVTNTTLNPNGSSFYLDDVNYEYEDKNFNVYTDAQQNWAGIYWQDPENNWGNYSVGGHNLTGATNLSFWAKGANGTEKIEFKIGGIGWDPKTNQKIGQYPDSLHPGVSTGIINLTKEWKQYTINLTDMMNLSNVIGGFCWVTNTTLNHNGCTFYLDDIRYNKQRLDELRFLVSFETTSASEDKYVKNVAFTYDNALVMLAFMERGSDEDLRRAKILGDSFVYCQNHDRHFNDGRLRNAYQAGDIADYQGKARLPGWWNDSEQRWDEDNFSVSTHTGNVAWPIIALLSLYEETREDTYINASIRLGEWIENKTRDKRGAGGYTGGYGGWEETANNPKGQIKIPWKSTEHNIDVYVAFYRLYKLTGDEIWKERALHAKHFVEAMWDEKEEHFWTGTKVDGIAINKDNIPADTNSWGLMAMDETDKYEIGLNWVENKCYVEADGFKGFDFNNDTDGIWFEGTAHMVIAYQILGDATKANQYLDELRKAQKEANNTNGKGIVAASHDGVSTGFDWVYNARLHIGATAWFVFAEAGYNPYWNVKTSEPIPPLIYVFDTGAPDNPYPSIFGVHKGTITPSKNITVQKLYTYPCAGTGGHTESVRFENESWNITASWKGYQGDWNNITFDEPFTLYAGLTYNYTIRTGSYPQIHHIEELHVEGEMGEINCTSFKDANGMNYTNRIPAIRLVGEKLQ